MEELAEEERKKEEAEAEERKQEAEDSAWIPKWIIGRDGSIAFGLHQQC